MFHREIITSWKRAQSKQSKYKHIESIQHYKFQQRVIFLSCHREKQKTFHSVLTFTIIFL